MTSAKPAGALINRVRAGPSGVAVKPCGTPPGQEDQRSGAGLPLLRPAAHGEPALEEVEDLVLVPVDVQRRGVAGWNTVVDDVHRAARGVRVTLAGKLMTRLAPGAPVADECFQK